MNKICTICSTEYDARGKRFATAKYCSMACYGKGARTTKTKVCRNCQTEFLFKPSQLNKYPNAGKYCSRKCGYEYRVKKGADKPTNDKWGRTGRKADVDWKLAVRAKFSCICQRCGIYNEYVDTHHIYTRSHRPDLKHEVSNGVALCRSCHSWVHHNPREAAEIGLLKGASYELARLTDRNRKIVESNLKHSTPRIVKTCTICGKERKYSVTSKRMSKNEYRCMACCTSTHIKRTKTLKGDK